LCAAPGTIQDAIIRVANFLTSRSSSGFKLGPESFTRGGPLRPDLLIALIVYMVADGGRRGYRHLIEAFWDDAKMHGLRLPQDKPISAASFCDARRKLKASALRVLLHDAADAFDQQHGAQHRFRGRRVLAVDGSKISVQRAPELWTEFGAPASSHAPQILVTTLFDVMAKVPVDATVAPFAGSEREQLGRMLGRLRPGDVVVLDQGFPSYEVMELLLSREVDFVMRTAVVGGFSAVESFVRSGLDEDQLMLIPASRSSARHLGPYRVRAVRRDGPDGDPQVFITSLPRRSLSRDDIIELYRRRWEVELFFRLEKGTYLGHDQFHARNADGVRQEVFALLLFVALTRTLMATAAEAHEVPYEDVSQKGALLAAAHRFVVLLIHQDTGRARHILAELLLRISRCRDKYRRRPSYPRRSFKPRPRWAAFGHVHDHDRRLQLG
jgi:Transposase DDE domain